MNRYGHHVLALTTLSLGLLVAAPTHAASLQKVSSGWASGVPSYVSFYIYVPDKVAAKPPIVVACHYCGGTASAYFGGITDMKTAADKNGFIIIVPEATGKNCWDVGSKPSLTHDGGGDTQAIAQMVKYTLSKYSADATRVYAMGGSSGAMMTQALMAVYPDLFRAGAARSGVPAGCWSDGYDQGQQWSNNCAGGKTTKTAQQWGDLVRGMFPGFTGSRPRLQLFHGTADPTINYNNMGESIKEWTNVLGLSSTPTTEDAPKSNYKRQIWKNSCGTTVFEAWAAQNGNHSVPYEFAAMLSFFGLDQADAPDPGASSCGEEGGSGGTGGATGAGGTASKGLGGASSKMSDTASSATGTGGRAISSSSRAASVGGKNGSSKADNGGTLGGGASSNDESEHGGAGGDDGASADGGTDSTRGGTSASTKKAATGGTSTTNTKTATGGNASSVSSRPGSNDSTTQPSEESRGGAAVANNGTPEDGGCNLSQRKPGRSVPVGTAVLLALGLLGRRQRRRNGASLEADHAPSRDRCRC